MAVDLKSFSVKRYKDTNQLEGFKSEEIKDPRKEAQERLLALRDDLRSKTGVVRLLHTTKANKGMKFKNAGAFKRMFLSGEKLKLSGEVIGVLLKEAGLSEDQVGKFKQYVEKRGNSGVKAQKVLQYIDMLRMDTGSTEEEVLSKFGVDLGPRDPELGGGASGVVRVVKYRGEDYVYKRPKDKTLGDLTLVDLKGNELKPDPVKLEQSFAVWEDEKPIVSQNPKYSFDVDDVASEPKQSFSGDQSFDDVVPDEDDDDIDFHALGKKLASGDFEVLIAPPASSDESKSKTPNTAAKDAPKDAPKEVELPKGLPSEPLIVEESPISAQSPIPSPAKTEGHKLGRTGLANAARVKDLPQVITPSVYVVEERCNNGKKVYHAVAGQKTLKDWAKSQNKGSSFEVVGLLMPKAAGTSPLRYFEKKGSDIVKSNVSQSDLKPFADSALTLLKGLARHGFIHGDIKPENLMWDAKAKKLQLIDNDSLHKVSKKDGSSVAKGLGAHTPMYMHPLGFKDAQIVNLEFVTVAQLGLGRDLYALGLVLLEAALVAKGKNEEAETLMSGITDKEAKALDEARISLNRRKPEKLGDPLPLKTLENYSIGARIDYLEKADLPKDSVEDFARTCLIEALKFEQGRIDEARKNKENNEENKNVFGFDRSDNGPEAQLLKKLEDRLAQVL